ncbi:ABC transporter substrate-binding protein [Ectothiorhodospiraceae bacterium WFHF3C12]|nr:ABC transporter substrate-binding protein [Ectothiorhodospiraceae bacterium WFHF3C12]
MRISVCLAAVLLTLALSSANAAEHGLAMYGEPRYGPGFEHFDYVNPQAPKGGEMRRWALGSFNSLNPFILKGEPASVVTATFDTLAVQSADEPFSVYGLIAEKIRIPEDRSSVTFILREAARFHDGTPIEPHDVIWTFNTLMEKGHPAYRVYYRDVAGVEKTGPRAVTFSFEDSGNRELPLILGQLPVLPEHATAERGFDAQTLEPMLGSGPYRVGRFESGRFVELRRVEDYWAADLAVNRGRHNFDRLRVEYFRDTNAAMEAFKAGKYDVREEHVSKLWATGYDFPAAEEGLVIKARIPHEEPQGMQAFFMNSRRAVFADPQVRHALAYAFDFQWTNETLFYGAYTRTRSYFANSELAARDLPSEGELALLEPYRDQLPEAVFNEVYAPPSTTGEGGLRQNLRVASRMLKDAGWVIRDGKRVNADTGEPLAFEIMISQPSMERVVNPFVESLRRLGVEARARVVDASQYQNRMERFDFDMTTFRYPQSPSPGNELRDRFGSEAAGTEGSSNYLGVSDPVVDALIDAVLASETREQLVTRTNALDRVLIWSHYVIPHWHIPAYRLAYWDRFGMPETRPTYAIGLDTWWLDAEKNARVVEELGQR